MRDEFFTYWSKEDKACLVEIPELSGCFADGASYDEAVVNAQEVIAKRLNLAAPRTFSLSLDLLNSKDFRRIGLTVSIFNIFRSEINITTPVTVI